MPETGNNTQADNTEPHGETDPRTTPDASRETMGGSCSCGMKSGLKMLWSVIAAILNYVNEEVPEPDKMPHPESRIGKMWVGFNAWLDSFAAASTEKPDAPRSRLKRNWAKFNAFLDSLEETSSEPPEEKTDVPGDPADRGGLLKKTGSVCWEIVFHGAIVVFLFVLAVFGTVKALDYVNARHVPFYPSVEARQYLAAEHEALEAVAGRISGGKDRGDDIPADTFGERCAALLKPVRIYSDDYGVYLVTSKSWYSGENGVFIARDRDNMPDDMSWGLIEGRIFAYAFYK